ncbi:unnamed protein product [Brassicogethes aeneus]|uniref:Uncharacterized protein n=1 Tax=Brassicogethes aeneus TaxID=1431903 RepID=A0A9P0AV97_BRAAE|nr:unnamed protein product [Brassicogethes aeneus]
MEDKEGRDGKKRPHEEDPKSSSNEDNKKPKLLNYYRLATESSNNSGSESVHSIQDRETDIVQDTSDTETAPSSSHNDVGIEYDLVSLPEVPPSQSFSSTNSEGKNLGLTLAQLMFNTTIGKKGRTTVFNTCLKCKCWNSNNLYRYCFRCFQERKRSFPPRPKGFKKRKNTNNIEKKAIFPPQRTLPKVDSKLYSDISDEPLKDSDTTDKLYSDINDNMTNDSDIPNRNSDIRPENSDNDNKEPQNSEIDYKLTEQDLKLLETAYEILENNYQVFEGDFQVPDANKSNSVGERKVWGIRFKNTDEDYKVYVAEMADENAKNSDDRNEKFTQTKNSDTDSKFTQTDSDVDLCMFCHSAPKNGIFLHTNMAHMCCCYTCAKKNAQPEEKVPHLQRGCF